MDDSNNPEQNGASKNDKISTLFERHDSDIIIRSSDNCLFRLHKQNLECATDGFPPSSTLTHGDIVALSESGAVLEILFQFMYPRPSPGLEKLEFQELILIAEAAEKYGVFNAMYAVQFALRNHIILHTKDVLRFAMKYHSPSLIAQVPLKFIIDTPLSEVIDILPPHIYKHWSIYREHWVENLHRIMISTIPSESFSHDPKCEGSTFSNGRIIVWVLQNVDKPSCLLSPTIENVFEQDIMNACQCCVETLSLWKGRVKAKVAQIPPFSIPE
ncbi:MAG: hypothetical protein NXY57DRAFT_969404 [Lentinula lateritia]|nr:MAG: hypothetical protein NXY57DRAFT_969404 [Lentinula lateritia]